MDAPAWGETPASFVERVRGLVSKNTEQPSALVGPSPQPTVTTDANRSERRPVPVHPKPGRSCRFRFLKIASPALLLAVAAIILIPP